MELIIWGDAYDVDIENIDNQHKGLVAMINDLYDAIIKNEAGNILNKIIPRLVTYAQEHFATEETYMVKYNYPEYEHHKQQHQEFINDVNLLVGELESGEKVHSISLFMFLKDWLLNHIAYTDKKLGNFLNTKIFAV